MLHIHEITNFDILFVCIFAFILSLSAAKVWPSYIEHVSHIKRMSSEKNWKWKAFHFIKWWDSTGSQKPVLGISLIVKTGCWHALPLETVIMREPACYW